MINTQDLVLNYITNEAGEKTFVLTIEIIRIAHRREISRKR